MKTDTFTRTDTYTIGDIAYYATFTSHSGVYVECPDCGGTGRIRCIFHDETVVSIDCGNCSRGYEPPSGRVLIYSNIESAEEVRITGMEISEDKPISYRTDKRYIVGEERLFTTKEKALEKAKEMHAVHVEEQKQKVFKKEKDTRSWAWNASYHRGLIKRAEKDLAYHTSKLNVASLKKKEKDAGTNKPKKKVK